MHSKLVPGAALLLALSASLSAQTPPRPAPPKPVADTKIKEPKPGWNLFSKEQDVQLGREAAAEIEKQVTVVNNPEVTQYLNRLGRKLATSKRASDFPYSFKLVADDSINAFALPGGPMYVHTGLIKASETEGQLVGVLAHEMSHVALRHGTNQATKANAIQIPLAIGGAIMGQRGGMLGQLAQLGIGLGANSVLMKFSRNAESQADYNGALMMSDAGYDPIEMARFFEKLEAQVGKQGRVAEFFASHPSPGNRVKNTEELVRLLPAQNYAKDDSEFQRMKQIVMGMPPPPKRPRQPGAAQQPPARVSDLRPDRNLKDYRTQRVQLRYPQNWEVFADQNSPTVVIAPRGGLVQTQQGVNYAYAILQAYHFPEGDTIDLRRETDGLVASLRQQDNTMQSQGQSQITVDGQNAILTRLTAKSPYPNETETIYLVTVARPDGLFYMALVAPNSEVPAAEPIFQDVVRGIRFPR